MIKNCGIELECPCGDCKGCNEPLIPSPNKQNKVNNSLVAILSYISSLEEKVDNLQNELNVTKNTSILNSYEKVIQRLNQLSSNQGQKVTEFQFVCAFNKAQYRWFEKLIKIKERDQSIQEDLQIFQKVECLKPSKTKTGHLSINLPEDYYYYQRVYGKCEKGCEQEVFAYPREESNVNKLLQDAFHKPSFGWQETFFTIGNCKLTFYIDDFTCSEITLVYYRCPREVDMLNTIHPDGKVGTNISSELSKGQLEEVLDLTVQILSGDLSNPRYNTISNEINAS